MSVGKDKYTDIVRDFCKLMPSVPSRTLARLILKSHNDMSGGSIDLVCQRVRKARGKQGRASITATTIESCIDGFIPPPMHKKREPYVLNQTGSILHIGDVHVPFHEPATIRLMMQYVTDHYDIKGLVINGDFWDCLSISKFSKDQRPPTMQEEKEYGEDVIETLEDAFPNAKKVWKLGNHEARLARYLYTNAPDLHELIQESVADLFGVKQRGWDVVGDKQLVKAGKLWVCHGGEVGINSVGVSPARTLYLKTQATALCFHLHNTSSYVGKTLDGKFPTCWSAGCLCDLQPEYCPHSNKHNHGFAVQRLEDDGQFELENFRILNGKVVR